MIQSFSCPLTQAFFESGHSEAFATSSSVAQRKLQQLDCAENIEALQAPKGNQYRKAQQKGAKHSIAIDDSWRLYFAWHDDDPSHVAIAQPLSFNEMTNNLPPTHPGEILREDYLLPIGMTTQALAQSLNVSQTHIEELVNETRAIDPEMALRLTRYFGGDALSWLNLQQSYELKLVEQRLQKKICDTIQPASFGSTNPFHE